MDSIKYYPLGVLGLFPNPAWERSQIATQAEEKPRKERVARTNNKARTEQGSAAEGQKGLVTPLSGYSGWVTANQICQANCLLEYS